MKKQILFVTSLDEDSDEGLSYAIDLTKTMDKDIAILLVHKKNWLNKFEDLMSAITFAEVNEHETAREILEGNNHKAYSLDEKIRSLSERCKSAGLDSVIQTVTADAVSAVLAEYIGAELLINATSTEGVYTSDPKKNRDAKKFDSMTPQQLIEIVMKTEMVAGANSPVDLLAAKIIERSNIKTIVLNGEYPQSIVDAVSGKHKGTVIEK